MGSYFREKLGEGLKHLAIEVAPEQLVELEQYFLDLKKWNRKVNLVARNCTDEQLVEAHFLDSLTLLPLLQGEACHLLDIGTGAGFPGLVCKIALPHISLSLVEPRLKRVSFLKQIVRSLRVTGVQIYPCRIEEETQFPAHSSFTHITGRAVTEIGVFLEMVGRFSPQEPTILCMKGPRWQKELAAAQDTIESSEFRLSRVLQWRLPFTGAERALVLFTTK